MDAPTPLDEGALPPPFGLVNTGAICYMNSLLQAIASCTALAPAAQRAAQGGSATARALAAYFDAAAAGRGEAQPLIAALLGDLAGRRPGAAFGTQQESASEALLFLLEMGEPPGADAIGPVREAMTHRTRCRVICGACAAPHGEEAVDYGVTINLLQGAPDDPEQFARALMIHRSPVGGACPTCGAPLLRAYRLTLAPEVLVVAFNRYRQTPPGGGYPARFLLPAQKGSALEYRLVAAVDHSGSLEGGHYWARVLRRGEGGPRWFRANDASIEGCEPPGGAVGPTYLAFYHFAGTA